MARRPSDIVQPNLRIQERLRRQLEQAAKKNGVSLNREMINRLERSFDQEAAQSINQAAVNAAVNLDAASTRYTQASAELKKLNDVVRTVEAINTLLEHLLEQGTNTPQPLAEAAAKLGRAIKQTEQQEAAAYQKLTTSGGDQ